MHVHPRSIYPLKAVHSPELKFIICAYDCLKPFTKQYYCKVFEGFINGIVSWLTGVRLIGAYPISVDDWIILSNQGMPPIYIAT